MGRLVGILWTDNGRLRLAWRILLFLFLFSVILILAALVPLPGIPGQSVPVLLAALVAGWILLRVDGRGPGALGFYLSPAVAGEALLGMGLGAIVALAVVAGMLAFGGVTWMAEGGSLSAYLRVGAEALWLFAIPAAAEEALLRGYLFQALAEGWGALRALWVTSLIFGSLHVWNPSVGTLALGNIVLAGLFLGVVYLKTASLWWASGVHLGWNWAHGFLADLPVSGLDLVNTPWMEARPEGPSWVSGGAFGPEGSLVATAVLVVASLWLWRTSRLRPGRRAVEVRPLILAGPESQAFRSSLGGDREISFEGRNS